MQNDIRDPETIGRILLEGRFVKTPDENLVPLSAVADKKLAGIIIRNHGETDQQFEARVYALTHTNGNSRSSHDS